MYIATDLAEILKWGPLAEVAGDTKYIAVIKKKKKSKLHLQLG